ncbi:hypothetical protein V5799_027538 [Amblyomma americanum]|uniref:Peptidase M13 N-terminal domain-containing protein n=1 Tax=Amblyomma americanum TaxID=6943 RepID=A0AAQ4DFF6_AMBAM
MSVPTTMPVSSPPPGACGNSSDSVRDESRRSLPALVALVVMAMACVALSLLALWTRLMVTLNKPRRTVCLSQACVALNDMLTASANASVNPCDDFYGHVCGGWAESASVYERHLSLFVDQVVSTLVQAGTSRVRGQTKQAAVLLQSCLAIVEDGRDELDAFRNKLEQLGVVWPLSEDDKTDGIAVVAAKVFKAFQISPLLTVRKRRSKAGKDVLHIEPGNVLPRWLKRRALLVKEGTYRSYFERATKLYANASTHQMNFTFFSYLEDRFIAKVTSADHNSAEVTEFDSVRELSRYVDPRRLQQLEAFLERDLKLPSTAKVRMRAVKYLRHILNATEWLGKWPSQMYLNWCVLQAMWRFISKPLSELWHQSVNATSDTVVEHPSHADCLELTESLLGWAVFGEFVRTHGAPSAQDGMQAIAKKVANALVSQVRRGRWSIIAEGISFDASDFEVALYHSERLGGARLTGAFDKVALNASLLQNWLNIAKASAYVPDEELKGMSSSYIQHLRESEGYELFDSRTSAIRIPPLFPMLPLYHQESTIAANYGAIGTLLGVAGVRLFLSRLPPDSPAFSKAEEKLECFASSASSGRLPPSRSRQHIHLAAVVDLVWEVFTSVNAWSADGNHLLNYTSEATFFVVMCHLLCRVRASLRVQMSCNEAVKNSRSFGEVFNCSVGTPMNPRSKCQFFSYA